MAKRGTSLMLLFVTVLFTSLVTLLSLKFFYTETDKIAFILDENLLHEFKGELENYRIVLVDEEVREFLSLKITEELYNSSFYVPMIILFEDSNQLEGVIVGYPSELFKERIKECIRSTECTPFIAYSAPSTRCEYCPRTSSDQRLEKIEKLSEEKVGALARIVKSRI